QCDALRGRVEIAADAEPAAIRKGARKTIVRSGKRKPVLDEAVLVSSEERRTGEQAKVHREEIVHKSRQRYGAGLDRGPGFAGAVDDRDLPPLGSEVNRRREAVVSRSDDDGVVHEVPSLSSACRRYPAASGCRVSQPASTTGSGIASISARV